MAQVKVQEEGGKQEHEPEAEQEGDCVMFGELNYVDGKVLEIDQVEASPGSPKEEVKRVWQGRAGQGQASRAERAGAPGEVRQ